MYSEVTEWEARGDGLRQAKRFGEALEAYRTALRHCFQWTHDLKPCDAIRDKIWAVQIEEFEAFAATCAGAGIDEHTKELARTAHTPDVLELAAARLMVCGAATEAELLVDRAVRDGVRGSGEFLDRLAEQPAGMAFAGSLRELALRLRTGTTSSRTQQAAAGAAAGLGR